MRFVLLFKGGMPKEADRETHMRAWDAWVNGLMETKTFESGYPFGMGGKTLTRRGDADYIGGADDMTGFMVINVPSEREALGIADKAPHMALGGTTIIRPAMDRKMLTKEELEMLMAD